MTSHVEQQIQARIARAKAEAERKRQQREELAAARTAGLAKRHAAKLRRLAEFGQQLAPIFDPDSNETLAASGA
ncbi:hypothetical protein EJ357_22690 [Streptomyces cyaneochromogenes]|uniref:Uncharacterized protein n=1 Tax=Streptomyces cyaneochromogenes TaxID=2496836 RepID=A0A3S9M9V0_9ACTN|nr:hypothetical protein [Streptomyces cyaneochromogenes]AZQ35941.1 hypothetical protein EJ357_22690 [Streptomyces cyaneochromogenes]